MKLTPGTRLASHEIVALIGAGGMGEVYRARNTKLDRDVAIKILHRDSSTDGDSLRRFELEASTTRRFRTSGSRFATTR